MNNVLVYCELSEKKTVADISLELCTKGRQLANRLGCRLQAAVLGSGVSAAFNPAGSITRGETAARSFPVR